MNQKATEEKNSPSKIADASSENKELNQEAEDKSSENIELSDLAPAAESSCPEPEKTKSANEIHLSTLNLRIKVSWNGVNAGINAHPPLFCLVLSSREFR